MSVVTISRGSFSGGKMLAECLAARLGFRCIDRDVIVERAAAQGVSQELLREALLKPPTFLERFQHHRYTYLTLFQAALVEEVRTGRAVYHGNAGHLLLRGGIHVLRVRIIAPLEFRLFMAQDRLKLGREEALAYIAKMDQDRKKWSQFLYGVDWGDPALYDMVINLEHMSIQDACDVVAATVQERCFEFTPECQAVLDDLALASRVRASLVLDKATADLELDVSARGGAVIIRGKLSYRDQLQDVRRVALSVPGVSSLDLDQLANLANV